MFATPSWMGSFITSRSNEEISDLNRKHEVMMEDIKHKHEFLIQESRNRVTEDVAKANRESTEEIARLNRIHEADLNAAKNKNAISVALIQAASRTANTTLPLMFPAFLAGRVSSNNDRNKNGKGNSNTPQPTATVVKTSQTAADAESNRKKADNLFPELEPTFGNLKNSGVHLSTELPRINVTQLVPAIGAVLSMAAPILAIL